MAGDAGSLVVSLGLNAAEYILGLTRAEYQTRQAMRSIQKSVDEAKHTMQQFAVGLAAVSGGLLSFHGLISAFEAIKEESTKSQQSILQFNAALQATQGAVGITSDDLEKLAVSIEHATTFDVDDIRNAETALLRFRDVTGDTFKQALKLIPDVAVAMGTDLPTAAQKLGRALEDPSRGVRGLRDAGLFLDETQKTIIQHFSELGDKAYGQKLILDELTKSTQGAAAAAGEGLLGANNRLLRSFHELEKAAGRKLFDDNLEGVKTFTGFLDRMVEHLNKTKLSVEELLEPLGLLKVGLREAQAAFKGYVETPQPGRSVSGKIRGLENTLSPEQQAAAEAEARKRQEQLDSAQLLRSFEAQKSFAEKSGSYYATTLMDLKGNLALQSSAQEFFYSQGLISAETYYNGLRDAAKREQQEVARISGLRGLAEEKIIDSNLSSQADRLAAVSRLNSIDAEGLQARIALRDKLQKYDQQEFLANKKLQDEFSELDAKVKEITGDLEGAAKIRLGIQFRDIGERALAQGDTGRLQAIDEIKEHEIRQIELNRATQQYNNLITELGAAQERITTAQQTGSLTTLEATNKQADVARKYIQILTEQLEVQRHLAETDPDPLKRSTALAHIEELQVAIERLTVAAEALQTQFRGVFTDAVSSNLTDAITKTKSWADAFKDAEKQIVRSITNIASQNIAESLFGKQGALGGIPEFFAKLFGGGTAGGALSSLFGGGKSNSIAKPEEISIPGNFIGDLLGIGGDKSKGFGLLSTSLDTSAISVTAFSTATTTATTALVPLAAAAEAASAALLTISSSSSASSIGSLFGGAGFSGGEILPGDFFSYLLPGFASGGFPPVGRASLVGENGPELFIPRSAGQIVSNKDLRSGKSNVYNLNVNVLPGASRASADQAAASMGLEVRRAMARNT